MDLRNKRKRKGVYEDADSYTHDLNRVDSEFDEYSLKSLEQSLMQAGLSPYRSHPWGVTVICLSTDVGFFQIGLSDGDYVMDYTSPKNEKESATYENANDVVSDILNIINNYGEF